MYIRTEEEINKKLSESARNYLYFIQPIKMLDNIDKKMQQYIKEREQNNGK